MILKTCLLLEANSTLTPFRQPKRVRNLYKFPLRFSRPFATGLSLLQSHFISSGLHNSAEQGDSPKCHENTRVVIIEEIMAWVNNSDRQTRVLWMNGAAGAGKTAITHTIAEMCYRARILAASFFFYRSIPGRNEKTFLITTIVSQLIVAIPGTREHVGNTLHQDHSLLSRSLEAQLEALIVKPLELAKSQADIVDSHPKLIILDSLDECGGPGSHQSVLQVILAAFKRHNLPFSFLVVSRPEQKIPSTNTPWVCLLSGWCLTTSTSRMKIFELSWCRCFTTSNEGTHLAPAFPLGLLKKTSNDWSKSHRASSFMHRLS